MNRLVNLEWLNDSNSAGIIFLQKQGTNTPISNLEIKFDKTKTQHAAVWGDTGLTLFPDSKGSAPTLTFDSQGNGIKLGADGRGTLTIQFALEDGQPRNSHANVIIKNESGNDALQGNLLVIGGYGNWDPAPSTPNLNATFYGNLAGNFNQEVRNGGWTPYSEVVFEKGSITGNVTVSAGGITLKFAEGGVQGNVTINTPGNSASAVKFIRTSNSDLSIGKTDGFIQGKLYTAGGGVTNFTVGYDASVQGGTKVISLNPEDRNKFEVTKGSFAFYNMKALNFVDDSGTKKTFTLQDGTINNATFEFDRAIIEGNQSKTLRAGEVTPSATIITGNLSAQSGKSIRLSLIDDPAIQTAPSEDSLKTLQVDGTITITNGGLSLFYNDRLNCFEAKVVATGGITQSGGYIGRNDAFFEANTFTEANGKKNISTIQGTSNGVSHLRFNDNVTIQDGISATSGNGTELYFYQGVNVEADSNGYAVSGNGSNTIYLDGTNTITGKLETNAGSITIKKVKDGNASLSLSDSAIKAFGGATASISIDVDNLTISGNSSLTTTGNSHSDNNNIIKAANADIVFTSISASDRGSNNIHIGAVGDSGFSISGRINAQGSASNIITVDSGDLQIGQGMIAQTYQATSQNIITLENGNLTIGATDGNAIKTHNTGSNSNTIVVNGNLTANGGIYADVNGKNEISFTGTGLVTGNIAGGSGSQNIFHLSGDSTTLKLQGQNNSITTLTGYTAPTQGEMKSGVGYATLILDGEHATTSNSGVSATIANALDNGAIAINFNGNADNIAKLTLSAEGNIIQAITLGSDSNTTSTNNTLELSTGATNIKSALTIASNNALTFDLADSTTLNFEGGLTTNGVATFNLGSSSAPSTTTTLVGTLSNAGENVFNVASTTTTLKYGTSGLVFSAGKNTINFNASDATLNWQDNGESSSTQAISTTGGTTNINFINSGTISGAISTSESGSTAIAISNGKSATISGNISTSGGNTAITFLGNESTPASSTGTLSGDISTSSGSTTISFSKDDGTYTISDNLSASGSGQNIIDASTNSAKIGNNLTFAGSENGKNVINIGDSKTLTLQDSNNDATTLTTQSGATYINFSGASTFSGNITTTAGSTTFAIGSNENLTNTDITTATITGTLTNNAKNVFDVNSKTSNLKYDSGLAFSAGTNVINFNNTDGATLTWQDSGGTTQAISTSGGTTQINFINSGTISGAVSTSDGNTTIAISDGKTATINGINTSGGNTVIDFSGIGTLNSAISTTNGTTTIKVKNGATGVITGNISNGITLPAGRSATPATNVEFANSGYLILQGKANTISNLTMGEGTNILSLTEKNGVKKIADAPRERRSVIINNINNTTSAGILQLVSQISATDADTFVIEGATHTKQAQDEIQPTAYYQFGLVLAENTRYDQIGDNGAVRVASVAKTANVDFATKSYLVDGFTTVEADFVTSDTDKNGGNSDTNYTTYSVEKIVIEGIVVAEQEITATAFALNYDLYMANLNSLNKRMGELRDNAHSHGAWARVFNGAQTNNQGLGSKSNYTTIQAGYDYAFGFEGANNYLGFALSYALSTSTSDKAFDIQGQQRGISGIYSSAVEVAVYNSYVSDMGWYNDTIAKFSYLMSSFDIDNLNTGSTTKNDTNNFAITLGDEVGYVFKLGESKEWSITPQAEFTFGYFNQSDFKQTIAGSTSYLDSIADAVLTLRSRVGSSFGYDFKNFTQESEFNASLYVGAFYEYDYVSGGNISMTTDLGVHNNELGNIGSDGRAVINVGTNMTIKDNTRLYFDFEKSFGGDITTDYQVNLGVRYSFGESNGYTPAIKTESAPLKVSDEKPQEQSDQENVSSEEKADTNKTEEKAQ